MRIASVTSTLLRKANSGSPALGYDRKIRAAAILDVSSGGIIFLSSLVIFHRQFIEMW